MLFSLEELLNQFFLSPMIDKTGYNLINTLTYALIAVGSIYVIYIIFNRLKIRADEYFMKTIFFFVIFGSSKRVITDGVDAGVLQVPVLSQIYAYNFFNISPGIYIFTGILAVFLFLIEHFTKKRIAMPVAFSLATFHLALVLPLIHDFFALFFILTLAAIPFYLAHRVLKDPLLSLVVFSHALDGAATFYAIDISKSYFEQHVLAGAIGDAHGYIAFYLIKIIIAFLAAYLIKNESENEKNFIATILIVIGLAPGIRDMLRVAAGV
ncbi:MAG: DUF63 family protein [Candidatus Anstonellales archaeon]